MIDAPEQLAAILKREYDAAEDFQEQLQRLQRVAFEYYEAQPFGTEVDGRSQIVLPDVQETIDYMVASVLRTFVSGDRVVEFEATNEDDEQAAEEATAALDYNFMRRQDGFRVLNDVANDGLLRKIGIFKACFEEQEKVVRERVTMDPVQLGEIGGEVEDIEENPDGTVTVTVKRETSYKHHYLLAVPTEEIRFKANAKHEDDTDYIAQASPRPRSELVSMGFDRDQVYNLPTYSEDLVREYESDRLDYFDHEASTPALQEVLLCEEYARIDVDGDGIAERVKVFRVENEILRWQGAPMVDEMGQPVLDENGEPMVAEGELAVETVEDQPFAIFCPFPRPHRLVGYSLADKVMDIQYSRSYVARQLFDGLAFSNLPRLLVAQDGSSDETLDDILSPIPGAPVRVRSQGAVTPLVNSFDVGKSLSVMEWQVGERESRTGITRLNQGLDADTLNKTATGTALMQAQGQQSEEYIARNLAEAMSRGFHKLYKMMRLEAEPFSIKVDGEYKTVDPSRWPEEINIRLRVGLGTGAKDKRVQARMALYEPLTAAIQQGLAGHEHAFNWIDGMARDTGVGQGSDFMFDPADEEVQQRMAEREQQPDPALVEVQGKMELERAKAGAGAILDREKAQAAIETDRMKAELDMQVAREKAALEAELARDKAEAEIELSMMRMEAEIAMKAGLPDNRPGGSLAE